MGVDAFTAKKSKQTKVLEEMRDEFGRDDVWIIAIEGDVFLPAYVETLRRLQGALEALDTLPSLGKKVGDIRRASIITGRDAPPKSDEDFEDGFEDAKMSGAMKKVARSSKTSFLLSIRRKFAAQKPGFISRD